MKNFINHKQTPWQSLRRRRSGFRSPHLAWIRVLSNWARRDFIADQCGIPSTVVIDDSRVNAGMRVVRAAINLNPVDDMTRAKCRSHHEKFHH